MEQNRFRLDDIPKARPPKTPDHYFEDLPQRIQARIQEKQKAEKVFSIRWSPRRTWMSVGAAAVVAVLTYFSWPTRQDSIGTESLSQVRADDIISYLKQQQNLSLQDLSDAAQNQYFLDSLNARPLQNLKVSRKDILDQVPIEDLEDII